MYQLTGITDLLKKNAHDQHQQTIKILGMSPTQRNY